MNKRILIALLAIVVLSSIIYLIESKQGKKKHLFYGNLTYTNQTYHPYDTKFCYEQFLTKAGKGYEVNDEMPNEENTHLQGSGKLWVIVSPYFLPNQEEINKVLDFAKSGNNVYISAFSISPMLFESLLGESKWEGFGEEENVFPPRITGDSLSIIWRDSTRYAKYTYPGIAPSSIIDPVLRELGTHKAGFEDEFGLRTLIQYPTGKGNIYIQLRPITMSNYFLLHKKNYQYLNQLFGIMDIQHKKVIWDSFYHKYENQRPEPPTDNKVGESFFWTAIQKHPPLLWAIWTFIVGAVLFMLVNFRRIVAPVPIIPEVTNNSLSFVKALSGLYWLKQDHKKIASKITLQFNEYLLANYRIYPKDITMENVDKIAQKTLRTQDEIAQIINYITSIEQSESITKSTLIEFYQQVFLFIRAKK